VTAWYDAVYGNDPSTDNVFGREALIPRRDPLLQEFLRLGGRLGAFPAKVAHRNHDDAPDPSRQP
jgi:hypothetical protein